MIWAFPEAARSYADTLLETLDFLNRSELSEPLLASGFGKVHHLRRRLTMIMSGTSPRLVSVWGGLGSLCLAVSLLPVSATWAQKPDEPKQVRIVVDSGDDAVKPNGDFVVIKNADGSIIRGTVATVDLVGDVRVDAAQTEGQVKPDKPNGDVVVIRNADGSIIRGTVATVNLVGDVRVDTAQTEGQVKPVASIKSDIVVLQTELDGASVSVTAGSPDEAIKQIKEQLYAISERGFISEKDQALQKALKSAVGTDYKAQSREPEEHQRRAA